MGEAEAPRIIALSEQDHGKDMKLGRGDKLTLTLPTQPGTGYAWTIAMDPAPRLELEGKPEISPGTGAQGGRIDQISFRFTAKSKGTTDLELHYSRAWEKTPPLKVFRLHCEVM